MADTINIEGMNDQMARTDSLVAKLAQDVDKLSTSFSNLSKSANVEKLLGGISNAFSALEDKTVSASVSVQSRVRSILNDLTALSEKGGKLSEGLTKGIKLDFIGGSNLSKEQMEFNAMILKMAENFEKARANVEKYKKDLLSLYASTNAKQRSESPDFLKEEKRLIEEISAAEKQMSQNAVGYLITREKAKETEELINKTKQKEKKDVQELNALYKDLYATRLKSDELFSRVNVKGGNVGPISFQQEEEALMERYNKKIAELEASIKRLAEKHPELAAKIKETFETQYIEKSIGIRNKQADAIDKVTQQIEKQRQKEEELAAAEQRRLLIEQRSTTQGALDFSAGVKTANQAKEAIQYLTAARNNLDRTDAKYKENLKRLNEAIRQNKQFIDEVTGASSRLQTRTTSLLQSTKQLAEGFGIMFSVYGISNFIRKLVQVTGEFEIQQTALKSIINSADKAQTMFGELQKMAVASPYSIQQLVSYNKQLAAYRVETDKLLPVLKQLGDVASGVGVDMQRLILAYGQVKAANYLRGQELRQFSEAGINILGELARRFSDAEGKVVSTGEVFDRVSKRLVKFEDVAAVFDDLTKKGGIFYDMQAKQAQTVRGQLMNLKDAFQIALYEIGQETNGSIKTFLRLLRWVASHLTTIAKIGSAALVTFVAWKTVLSAIELKTNLMARDFDKISKSFPRISSLLSSLKAHPIAAGVTAAVVAITALIVKIVKMRKHINDLRMESVETFSAMTESVKDLQKSIADSGDYQLFNDNGKSRFKLVKTDNLDNDIRLVKNFIESLEKQGIELKPGFDLKYSEQEKDKVANQLADFMNDVQDRASNLVKSFEEGKEKAAKTFLGIGVKDDIRDAVDELENFKELIRKNGIQISDEIQAIGTQTNAPVELIERAKTSLERLRNEDYKTVSEAYELWKNVVDAQQKIEGLSTKTERKIIRITKNISGLVRDISDVYNGFAGYNGKMLNTFDDLWKGFQDAAGYTPKRIQELLVNESTAKKLLNEFLQYTKGAFQESGKNFTDDVHNQLVDWFSKKPPIEIDFKPMYRGASDQLEQALQPWQEDFNNKVRDLNKTLTVSSKKIKEISDTESDKKRGDVLKDLKADYDDVVESINRYEKAHKNQKNLWEDGDYKNMIKWRDAVVEAGKYLGEDFTKSKSGKGIKDISSEFEKMVKFIRQLRSEYEKLNKTFPSEDAAKRVADSFRDEFEAMPKFFQDVFGGDISNIAFLSPEQVVESLNKIRPIIENNFKTWQQKLQIFFEKNKAEEQVEIDVEFKKKTADEINRQIEELFSNYEIQLQLTELGLTSEDAKNIFNLDSIELGELGKKLSEFREEVYAEHGEDEINKYREFEKKYTEIYEKAQMERLKKYSAYLQKEMSERIKVEMDTLKQLAELDAMPSLYSKDSESLQSKTRERIRERILEERDKKIAALQWKEFQQSDLYVSLFTDIGNASYQSMRLMKNSLEDLRGSLKGLSATDLKAISDNLRQIDEQLLQDNPFDALITSVKDFKKIREDLEKDETLKKILGVDEIGKFRKSIKQGIEEINKELNGYVETQKDGSNVVVEGLTKQLAKTEELYQAAKLRATAESELKKLEKNFGAQDYFPEDRLDALKQEYEVWSKRIKESQDENEIQGYKTTQATIQKTIELLEQYIAANKKLGDQSGKSTEELGKEYDKLKKKAEEYGITIGKLTEAQLKARIQMRAASEALKSVSETVAKIQGVYETWMENLDYLGGATDDLTEAQARLGKAVFESLRNVLELTSRILEAIPKITEGFSAAGVAINSSMGIIGLIAEAIQLVITLVSAIGKFKDDMIAVDIKNVQRKINTLTRSYEALSEAFASAFDANRIREFNRLMVNNLEQQRDFLQQELALEQDKKKSDLDAIHDLSNQIEDIDKQLADVSAKFYEELGGFGSDSAYKDAATQFVDDWYNAFMETGSGLSGLEDTFNEFFVRMIKKQLMQKVADQYFKDLLAEFDELLNRGDIWDNDYFWNNYMNDLPDRLADANEVLTEYFQRWQGLFGTGGIGGLGNLQQGIQGVTEQTADILATYLNSIRLYVAQDNQNMTALINWLGVGTTNDSLMSNIRLTAQNTAAINTLLQSLVPGQAHTLGGAGLKVFVA